MIRAFLRAIRVLREKGPPSHHKGFIAEIGWSERHWIDKGDTSSLCGRLSFKDSRILADNTADHPDNCIPCLEVLDAAGRLRGTSKGAIALVKQARAGRAT